MLKLVERIGQEFKSMRTLLADNALNALSNVGVLSTETINRLRGPLGPQNTNFNMSVSTVVTDQFPDNTSIYIKPTTNIAYYKTPLGWIEIGKLMTQPNKNNNSISCGYNHTVFLLADGTCKAVGKNDSGQLGDGTNIDQNSNIDFNKFISVYIDELHNIIDY
jgi:hypothetical protein